MRFIAELTHQPLRPEGKNSSPGGRGPLSSGHFWAAEGAWTYEESRLPATPRQDVDRRPRRIMGTDRRAAGPLALWTAEHLAEFLSAVNDDLLFALWWLAALRGLRRGELCGLRWADIDLDRSVLTIARNRTTAGYHALPLLGAPEVKGAR